jgi:TRAP-type mannitol/chloroaromatic compound transport system permease small subunit
VLQLLLRATKPIDFLNERVGEFVRWAVLVAVLIAAGNATIRYTLDTSSNAWLEAQWYLFSAVFLLCSGYTLLRNEHVRIDVLISRYSHRTQGWIDLLGGLFFLLPMSIMIMVLSWPIFLDSYRIGEISTDAGGLIRWPAKLLIPVGFLLLTLQGIAEIIKRAAFLAGIAPDPYAEEEVHPDLALLEELKKQEKE